MIDTDRAVRACRDVLTVEKIAPGMARVITLGGCYTVDARGEGCQCADKQYNLGHGEMCKHHAAAFLATSDDYPTPFPVVENVDERPVATDGGSDRPDGCECAGSDKLVCWPCYRDGFEDAPKVMTDGGQVVKDAVEYRVIDHDNDNERTAKTYREAEDMAETARQFGSENVEIVEEQTDDTTEVVDAEPLADAEPVDAELSPRDVTDDPIAWLERNGGDFVDYVGAQNKPAINRKGFEVLSHFYEIDVHAELQVGPEETDFEFCRVKATATTPEGRECQAFGSAHVDRGDDAELLLEMADTRARKRALSIATGVGAVAVEEMTGAGQ